MEPSSHNAILTRLVLLEERIALLEDKCDRHIGESARRLITLDVKTDYAIARAKDIERIEKLAGDAYVTTHPDTMETMMQVDRIVPLGNDEISFANIPSVRDTRNLPDKS